MSRHTAIPKRPRRKPVTLDYGFDPPLRCYFFSILLDGELRLNRFPAHRYQLLQVMRQFDVPEIHLALVAQDLPIPPDSHLDAGVADLPIP